ncbi:alpha/beta fold hydrolase [Bdellovibrio sp. HCB2-146]|uniref:alpha/beta fold hydrolase n=1 Tax=Bdellovibrio sp. HCB2-146 TaxID=3394362 RepID=UPI0039BD8DFC
MKAFVFLPGTLCDERLWQYQLPEFSKSIVVNLRTQNTLEKMLDSVYEVSFDSFVLVGFSMGGYVAQEFALRYSERVEHLVVMGSSTQGYPPKEQEVITQALPVIRGGLFKGITDRRLREFLHPKSYAKPELRELIHSMAGPDAAQVYLRQLEATLGRRDLSSEIGNIVCPLTAIGGHDDHIVSAESILAFNKLVPNAQVQILEECGHFVPLEQPAVVNEILHGIYQLP